MQPSINLPMVTSNPSFVSALIHVSVSLQLPASSKWAAQQPPQAGPSQTRSLTDIQAEESRRERDDQREVLNLCHLFCLRLYYK